ncbi:MAG: amidohydrolase [Lachnospiraceae bacterium]|nr:amidohydrolase [Lachnospiraceae bacterium]
MTEITEQQKEEMIALRRWFHAHPEICFEEHETAAKIREELDKLDIPWQSVGTGTVAVIEGKKEGAVIGLRADIDALRITEKNEVSYRSQNEGAMHACGHDAHTAALLGAARILKEQQDQLEGTVKLIFQPAEEIGRGAQTIVDSGLIDDVNFFFGIHVRSLEEVGLMEISKGAVMGGANSLKIFLQGKSAHGGRPHLGIDTITCGAQIVQGLQNVVSREISAHESAVISVGMFHGGTAENIVAGETTIKGTIRVLSDTVREQIADAAVRLVKGIAAANRVSVKVESEFETPILKNSELLYDTVKQAGIQVAGAEKIIPAQPDLGTEDFSAYSQIAPSFFVFVGAGGSYPHHHERFDLDENVLPIAAAMHVAFVSQCSKIKAS